MQMRRKSQLGPPQLRAWQVLVCRGEARQRMHKDMQGGEGEGRGRAVLKTIISRTTLLEIAHISILPRLQPKPDARNLILVL